IWQPEFTDKTLSRKTGAVQTTALQQKRENNRSDDYESFSRSI
ncbi:hypothetical protein, partial [Escherichia coli]